MVILRKKETGDYVFRDFHVYTHVVIQGSVTVWKAVVKIQNLIV